MANVAFSHNRWWWLAVTAAATYVTLGCAPSMPRAKRDAVFLLTSTSMRNSHGRIEFAPNSLLIDMGAGGSVTVPYGAVDLLWYGSTWSDASELARAKEKDKSLMPAYPRYPWSGQRPPYVNPNYLQVIYGGGTGHVVFEPGEDIVKSTLATIEERTGRRIVFQQVDACLRYRARSECYLAEPSTLKGLTKVYIDTSERYDAEAEFYAGKFPNIRGIRVDNPYERIKSTVIEANLGMTVVTQREEAEIILAFRAGYGWTTERPTCIETKGYGPDQAKGEVYVVDATGMRAVMLFDEGCRIWRRWLATTFAEQFVEMYRNAVSKRR
jgi:hypothetical protein